jgi:Zinc-binding dehydrogenase
MARSIGADHVIDYTQEDFSRNGRRYDLILAVNGNHALRDYTRALSPGETAVVLGGSIPQFLQGVVLATWDIRSSTRSTWECMRCMRSREEDSLVGRDVIRACCQWQPQLSKKRDFFPSMVPHEHVPYSLRNRDQGERNKTCPKLLSGPGHDRGTDRNRRATNHRSHLALIPLEKLFTTPMRLYSVSFV